MTARDLTARRLPAPDLVRMLAPLGVVVLLALLIHATGPMLGGYNARVLTDVGIAMVLAVSLNIVNGFTGQFSLGHAAFLAIGGYAGAGASYYATLALGLKPTDLAGSVISAEQMLLLLACVIGGSVSAMFGWLVGLPSLRLRGDYLAIVTLGFGEIVRIVLQQTRTTITHEQWNDTAFWSETGLQLLPFGGAEGFRDIPKLTNLFWVFLCVGVVVLFSIRLKYSSTGRAMISIREDEIASEAMGIDVTRLKVRAFIFAAFFAGVAGALFAHQPGNLLEPAVAGFQRSIDVVIMVVLGGLGSISGALVAAIIVEVSRALLADFGQYRMILFALLLILLMIFRPQGIFGIREVWDLLPKRRAKSVPELSD